MDIYTFLLYQTLFYTIIDDELHQEEIASRKSIDFSINTLENLVLSVKELD